MEKIHLMTMAVMTICALAGFALRAAPALTNLAQSEGVAYVLVDDAGETRPFKAADKRGRYLVDGRKRTGSLATRKAPNTAKALRIRFDLLTPVSIEKVVVTRKYPQKSHQRIDRIRIRTGHAPDALRVVKDMPNPDPVFETVKRMDLEVPVDCRGRYLQVDLMQEAHPGHARIAIMEVQLLGPRADHDRILVALARKEGSKTTAVPRKKGPLWLERQLPVNVFQEDKPVVFQAHWSAPEAGSLKATWQVRDFCGNTVVKKEHRQELAAPGPVTFPVSLDSLNRGYYELDIEAGLAGASGDNAHTRVSFGVWPLRRSTARHALSEERRFGIKMWTRNWFQAYEAMGACSQMGLNWTRELFTRPLDVLEALGVNTVVKVEKYPKALYDEERYGPIRKLPRRRRRKGWAKSTVPQKQGYQAWLRERIKRVPQSQNVFEIWNEPWNKGWSGQEFAEVCRMAVAVIRELRPDAVIGPNLGAKWGWDNAFADAGGLEGMDMVALHPYTQFYPEMKFEGGMRQFVRERRRLYEEKTGRRIDIYTTEFGWSTPPGKTEKGKFEHMTEALQARWTVRVALAFYAEDVKTLIPHVLGQAEKNPADHEDFFGFFRASHQPKPVLPAYANCARMIDGSRYVGDLDYGRKTGAMVFERDGVYTVALWTAEESPENLASVSRDIVVDVDVPQVRKVDLMGDEKRVAAPGGKLPITISSDVTYLVGVSPDIERRVTTGFNPEKWPCPTEFKNGKPGRGRMHYPPRASPEDRRWKVE